MNIKSDTQLFIDELLSNNYSPSKVRSLLLSRGNWININQIFDNYDLFKKTPSEIRMDFIRAYIEIISNPDDISNIISLSIVNNPDCNTIGIAIDELMKKYTLREVDRIMFKSTGKSYCSMIERKMVNKKMEDEVLNNYAKIRH